MDRLGIDVADGTVVVDQASVTLGPAPGQESLNEPPPGPECVEGEESA